MDSKTKNPLGKRLIFITFALVLFTFLFPRTLGRELFFKPLNLTSAEGDKVGKFTPDSLYFQFEDSFVVIDGDGNLVSNQPKPGNFSNSDTHYSWYDQTLGALNIYEKDTLISTLKSQPYASWFGSRLYTFDENRMGISEYGTAGAMRWTKDFSSIITALDSGSNLTLIGLSDGRVVAYDKDGKLKLDYAPGGSRLPVVFNVALEPREKGIAVISGLDPKRFILLEQSRDEFRPVFHKPIEDSSHWATAVGFLENGAWAYYADGESLHLINVDSFQELVFPTSGTIEAVSLDQELNLLRIVTRKDGKTKIIFDSFDGMSVASLAVFGSEQFFKSKNGKYFMGFDNKILTFSKVMP